jgi:hypothetical protein
MRGIPKRCNEGRMARHRPMGFDERKDQRVASLESVCIGRFIKTELRVDLGSIEQ